MGFFKPSQQLAEDFAKQYDPQSNTRPDFTSKKAPDFSGPIDVELLREAISERLEMWIGTLIRRRMMLPGGTEIQLIAKGTFTSEIRTGLWERLNLSGANKWNLIHRLADEFKEWATGPDGRASYASWDCEVEDDIGSLILSWPRSVNDRLNAPTLPPLDKN